MSAFLDSIIENIPIMLFIKDAEHLRFERLNRASEELLGIKREAMRAATEERNHDPDDIKQAAGDIYDKVRRTLRLVKPGNNTDVACCPRAKTPCARYACPSSVSTVMCCAWGSTIQ